jgi:glucosamine-phosphate N-acetyltransferase
MNNIKKNIEENFIFREITNQDYNNGYLELLYEFTNYKHEINENEFKYYLSKMKNNKFNKIIVITTKTDSKIIGAGTIFRLEKLHNNPIGQIEDVIISNSYRGYGLGKLLIEKLINIGLVEFNCYKIILNCLSKNKEFYKKCNFIDVGIEMKYNK